MRLTDGTHLGAAAWDRLLLGRPGASLLQSWAWGELQSRYGWSIERLLLDGGEAGLCSLQRATTTLPGGALFYVPRGPAAPPETGAEVVSALTERAGADHGVALRIEPDAAAGSAWEEVLVSGGFSRGEPIQPAATRLLRIDRTPEELRAGFKPKTRYNLALAERKEVRVSRGDDVEAFARLAAETARRQEIVLPGAGYYRTVLQLFGPDNARLYLAAHSGRPLAGILVVRFGETATYLYGGSLHEGRELMPNYLLHWTAIQEFQGLGCTTYDWWGIPDQPSPDHPWFGLYRFKTGFGGETVRYAGLYERALRPLRFRVERGLRKLKRRVRGPILG